jgi:hypothetical protein
MERDSHSSRWHSARAHGDYKRQRIGESCGSQSLGAAVEEEARGDGTCGNPSKLDIVPHLERESFPKVVVNVAIPFQTGKHPREPIVEGDVNADDNAFFGQSIADGIQERKERGIGEESKLYSSFYGKFIADFIEESTPEAGGKLPHKYVGQWDSTANKMRWQSLGADDHIQLEKDPNTDKFFPRVLKGTRGEMGQAQSEVLPQRNNKIIQDHPILRKSVEVKGSCIETNRRL